MPERQRLQVLCQALLEDSSLPRREILEALETAPAPDIAWFLEQLPEDQSRDLFLEFKPETAGEILVELEEGFQKELVESLPIRKLTAIVDTLAPDDAADIYNLLPLPMQTGVLAAVDKKLAEEIKLLSQYEEESAGGIMTTHFLSAKRGESVRDVLEAVARHEDTESDQIYVTDGEGILVGVVSIPEILQADDPETPVEELMDPQVISIREHEDQEDALRQASNYGLHTLPVTDRRGRLVGIITPDDLDEVAEEEASEDIFRMVGTSSRHPTRQPIWKRILNRLPMLCVTVGNGLVIARIVELLGIMDLPGTGGLRVSALRFLPIVVALAGNVANIENAIVVRGLATEEIEHGKLWKIFLGEFLASLVVGLICAGLTFLGIGLLEGAWFPLGFSVGLALFGAVVFSAAAGFCVPIMVDRLKHDPALTGPLVTALNDLAGTAVYVAICLVLLHGPDPR